MHDGERASAGFVFLPLVYGAWLHVDNFPHVAIEVLKSMAIHKTVILWFIVGCSAGGDCLANYFIDFFSALRRQTHQHFCTFRGITNCFGSKSLELVLSQEHDEDVLAHNHASGRLVSKLRIEFEIEFSKELYRLIEIFHC